MLKQKSGFTKDIRVYPLGTIDVCTKYLGNSFNCCQGFHQKQKMSTCLWRLRKRGSAKLVGFILWGPYMSEFLCDLLLTKRLWFLCLTPVIFKQIFPKVAVSVLHRQTVEPANKRSKYSQ